MVRLLGKFLARSMMTTRVPIMGPSTVMSEKMPAAWAPPKLGMVMDLVDMPGELGLPSIYCVGRRSKGASSGSGPTLVRSRVCSEGGRGWWACAAMQLHGGQRQSDNKREETTTTTMTTTTAAAAATWQQKQKSDGAEADVRPQ